MLSSGTSIFRDSLKGTIPLLILIGNALISSNNLSAAPTTRLSLKKAIEMAIASSEQLKIRENENKKNQFRYDEEIASLYPNITGEVTWTKYTTKPNRPAHTHNPVTGAPIPLSVPVKKDYELQSSVTLSQVVWAFGKIKGAIDLAKKALSISEISQDIAKREIIYSTKMAYLTVLYTIKKEVIAKQLYESALKNKRGLTKRFSHGRSPKGDLIMIEADIATRLPSLKNAQSEKESAMKMLKMLINVEDSTPLYLTDNLKSIFPNYYLYTLLQKMNKNEPTLKVLRKSIDLNDNIAKLQKATFYPTIAAFGNYTYGGEGDNAEVGTDNMKPIGALGLTMTFTLWDSGVISNKHRQALVDKDNAILTLSEAEKGMRLELRRAVVEMNALKDVYKASLRGVKLSEKSYTLTRDLFNAGKVSLPQLNNAENTLNGARIQSLGTLFQINSIIARIEKLTAQKG